MPQYRDIRADYSFIEMCHTPEIAAEVTLLPVRYFGMDAAILFSDILVIPEALGVGLRFEEGVGPIIERPIRTIADIDALPSPNIPEALSYVAQTIKILRPELRVPLIGFCGAPFTVASYMIEGGSSRDLKTTKQWMLREPQSFHKLLGHIAECSIDYLNMQIDAGAQALQIFDSWACHLGHTQFREFSLAYLEKILYGLKDSRIPTIIFCRGSSVFAQQLAEIAPAGISIDWNADITQMRSIVPSSIALQGNLDPDILYAPHNVIHKEVKKILRGMKSDPGFIFNLGHGIHPDIPMDAVSALVDCVQSY